MLTKCVVKVQLTYLTETEAEHLTSYVGTPLWRVDWVESTRNGKTCSMRHSHYTEASARQHVKGLLGHVDPALGNVYLERL